MILFAHFIPLLKLRGIHELWIELSSLPPQLLIFPPPKILVLLLLSLLLQLCSPLGSAVLLCLPLLHLFFDLELIVVICLLLLFFALLPLLHTLGKDVHEVILFLLHLDLHLVVHLGGLLQHGLLDRVLILQFILVSMLQFGIEILQRFLNLLPVTHLFQLASSGGLYTTSLGHWLEILGCLVVLLFFLHGCLIGDVTITPITIVIIVHLLCHEEVLGGLLSSPLIQVLHSPLFHHLHLLLDCLLIYDSLLGVSLILRHLVMLDLLVTFHVFLQSFLDIIVQILELLLCLPVSFEAFCEHVLEILLLGLQLLLLFGKYTEPSTSILALAFQ